MHTFNKLAPEAHNAVQALLSMQSAIGVDAVHANKLSFDAVFGKGAFDYCAAAIFLPKPTPRPETDNMREISDYMSPELGIAGCTVFFRMDSDIYWDCDASELAYVRARYGHAIHEIDVDPANVESVDHQQV